MSAERNSPVNEHVQNIRAGLPVLKTNYGLTLSHYDYLDMAVDTLRDINTFGVTPYMAYLSVDEEGKATLPCNLDVIEAVCTKKTGAKLFGNRVRYDLESMLGTDAYYTASEIMESSRPGHHPSVMEGDARQHNHLLTSGLSAGQSGAEDPGYVPYLLLDAKTIAVDPRYSGEVIVIAYIGISVDIEGYPMITRKQANAIAATVAKNILLKKSLRGDQGAANSLQFFMQESGRLKQAAAIPENISDNDLDEILDAKTSFNRKSYRRPTRYSR